MIVQFMLWARMGPSSDATRASAYADVFISEYCNALGLHSLGYRPVPRTYTGNAPMSDCDCLMK